MVELLSNFDCKIQYHPSKANVIVNVLSRELFGCLSHITVEKIPVVKEFYELINEILQLEFSCKVTLVAQIKVILIFLEQVAQKK